MKKSSKILIVDDNEVNRTILKHVIEKIGHGTLIAKNGSDAIKLLQEQHVDLVLLDIIMPEVNGYDVLNYMRNDSSLSSIPVIIVSSLDEMDSIVKCIGMGAEDYLQRPIKQTLLNARIGASLEKKALRDQEQNYRDQIEKLLSTVQADIKLGATMQKRFLTNEKETMRIFEDIGFKVTIFNKGVSTISGDFYYPKLINLYSAGIFFADVCGHGVSAALISMRILSIVDHLRSPIHHASEFMEMVNTDIHEIMPVGHFVAASYLILNQNGFVISNAAQPYPIVIQGDKMCEIKMNSRPLGQDVNTRFHDMDGKLSVGDKLILYTDGIIEAADTNGNLYGEERFFASIRKHLSSPVEEPINYIISDLTSFTGSETFEDDITLGIFEKK